MALINCPECDCEVSDQALACPNCGYPVADGAPPSPQAEGGGAEPPQPEASARRRVGCLDVVSPALCALGGFAAVFFFQRGDTKHAVMGALLFIAGAIGTVALLTGRPWYGREDD